jgi:hypothetical protein
MTHITKIVKYEALSSGQVAATIRCDADPSTDFSLTMAVEVGADATKRTAALTDAANTCKAQHQAALDAQAGLIDLVGTTIP